MGLIVKRPHSSIAQSVSEPPNGLEVAGVRWILLDLLTDSAYVYGNADGTRFVLFSPNAFDQIFPGKYFSWMISHKGEYLKLFGREADDAVGNRNLVSKRIDNQIADLHRLRKFLRFARLASPQEKVDENQCVTGLNSS